MKFYQDKIPCIIFVYTAIVLASLLCLCLVSLEKAAMEQDLLKWQDEVFQLKDELIKIKRYSEIYQTSPNIVATVLRESERHGIEPSVMLELIKKESSFNPQALSIAGARGLCQIRPITARELSEELGIAYQKEMLEDVEYNISLGTYYLAKLLKMNDYDYHRALTAYNRGPAGMEKYIERHGSAASQYSISIQIKSQQLALLY